MNYHFYGGGQLCHAVATKFANFPYNSIYTWKRENHLGFPAVIKNQLETNQKLLIIFSATQLPCKDSYTFKLNIDIIKLFLSFFSDFQWYEDQIRVIYFSTDAVYKENTSYLDEDSPVEPSSWYGKMHLTRELLMRSIFEPYLLILRPVAVFGSFDKHKAYGPNRFIEESLNNRKITLHGDGLEKRNHLYISDMSSNVFSLLNSQNQGTLNLSTSYTITFHEIATIISNLFSAVILKQPYTEDFPRLRNVSNLKMQNLLGDKYSETEISVALKQIYRTQLKLL